MPNLQKIFTGQLSDKRPQLWAVDAHGALWSSWKLSLDPNIGWTAWQQFPTPLGIVQVVISQLENGVLQLWAVDRDGSLWSSWKQSPDPNAAWTPWVPFSRPPDPVTQLAAAHLVDGRIQLWAVTATAIWSSWKLSTDPNAAWTQWQSVVELPSTSAQKIFSAQLPDKRAQLWAVDAHGALWSSWEASTSLNSGWTAWQQFLAPAGIAQVVTSQLLNGVPQLWAVDKDGSLWSSWKESADPNVAWTPWVPFPRPFAPVTQLAAAHLVDGRIQLWAVTATAIWSSWKLNTDPNAAWTPWQQLRTRGRGFVSGLGSTQTQHNDHARSDANLVESTLVPTNVKSNTFGKVFTRALDGHVYAQPLYVANVPIVGKGRHNVIFVATAHNTVYAYDADTPAASAPLWSVNLGPSVPSSVINTANILVEVGIIATPCIDIATNLLAGESTGTIYVTAKTLENNVQIWRLHALDITTGNHVHHSPVQIAATVAGRGEGSTTISFRAEKHNNRPGLLLINGLVCIAFASHEDHQPYHGWIFGYNASNLQAAPSVFITTPDGLEGGIWQGGEGLTADTDGNVYCMVGNGSSDAVSGGRDYGEGFLKLSTEGGKLALVDWFIPYNYDKLNTGDTDVGSGGPLGLPNTTYLVGGGKDGTLYVLDADQMGRFNAGADAQIVQSFKAWNGELMGGPVYWNSAKHGPVIYVWGGSDVGKGYTFSNGRLNETPIMGTPNVLAHGGSNSPALSISASGGANGILWATMSTAGDADHASVAGALRAFDANDLSIELWNSELNPARDRLGNWAKFCPPTVANSRVYVATHSHELCVYALL